MQKIWQKDFADRHIDGFAYDIERFNSQLMDWLIRYKTERPHWSLLLKSPMQFLLEWLQLPIAESTML